MGEGEDEPGIVTGDTSPDHHIGPDVTVNARIQYTEAEEWYTLTGSPFLSRRTTSPSFTSTPSKPCEPAVG